MPVQTADEYGKQLAIKGFGVALEEKIPKAIKTLQYYEDQALQLDPDMGYFLGFSGGKDSIVIKDLAARAGVKHQCFYSCTTIDPPELVHFIKEHHADVEWLRQPHSFFHTLATRKGIPTRRIRWCCEIYKEQGGAGKVKVLGIRAAESARRANNWRIFTPWRKDNSFCCNPILYWTDDDVWEYIRSRNLPYCKLYDEGFTRLGCVGCPMGRQQRAQQFERWPGYRDAWLRAITKYWETHKDKLNRGGKPYTISRFSTAKEAWDWWLSDGPVETEEECTMGLF